MNSRRTTTPTNAELKTNRIAKLQPATSEELINVNGARSYGWEFGGWQVNEFKLQKPVFSDLNG